MPSHDIELGEPESPAETPPAERAAAARRVARRVAHHERGKAALLVPMAWLAGLHGASWIAEALDVSVLIRLGVTVLGVAVVLGLAERRGRDLPYGQVGLATLWILASIVFGPYGWVPIALWVVGSAVSVPFWVAVLRRPARTARREIEPAEPATPAIAAQARLWDERVAPNHQAYKNTHLADVGPVPDGYTATIVGEPGQARFSLLAADSAVETIASANQVRLSQVAVEEDDDGDASRARLTVIRSDSNLQGSIYLEDSGAAVDPKTGTAQVGRFFDMKPTSWNFFTPSGGVAMCTVVGGTGAGKSGFGELLISLAHRSPLMGKVLLDPQGGASQVNWKGKTDVYAEGEEQTFETLQMLDYVMDRREHFVAHVPWADDLGRERTGKPFLLPGDPDLGGMTMLAIFLEELRLLLDGPFGKSSLGILSPAVRTWRKPGGGLIVFNQNFGLENFGSDQSFRSNLKSGGSIAAFRTGSSSDHHMLGIKADPAKLPEYFRNGEKTHGLGYISGVDRRPAAPWRSIRVRDAFGIATTPAAGGIDERTLGYMEEYRHQHARGRTAEPTTPAAPRRTSGDVQATVESVLATGPMEVGAVCVAVQRRIGEVPLSEIPAALRTLTKAGTVRQSGDLYQLAPN